MADKFPELRRQLDQLRAEKAELDAVVMPLRAQRDALVAKMQPLEDQARDLAQQIKQHMPRMAQLDQQIAALAKVMGGKVLSEGGK